MLLIKNGLINDAVNREPYAADILVDEGKIELFQGEWLDEVADLIAQ